jgi:hypothetical protein
VLPYDTTIPDSDTTRVRQRGRIRRCDADPLSTHSLGDDEVCLHHARSRFAHALNRHLPHRARGDVRGCEPAEAATSRCDVQLRLLTNHCMPPRRVPKRSKQYATWSATGDSRDRPGRFYKFRQLAATNTQHSAESRSQHAHSFPFK